METPKQGRIFYRDRAMLALTNHNLTTEPEILDELSGAVG